MAENNKVIVKTERRIYQREIHDAEFLNDMDKYTGRIGAGIGLAGIEIDRFNEHCYGNNIDYLTRCYHDLVQAFDDFMNAVKEFENRTLVVQTIEE